MGPPLHWKIQPCGGKKKTKLPLLTEFRETKYICKVYSMLNGNIFTEKIKEGREQNVPVGCGFQ